MWMVRHAKHACIVPSSCVVLTGCIASEDVRLLHALCLPLHLLPYVGMKVNTRYTSDEIRARISAEQRQANLVSQSST